MEHKVNMNKELEALNCVDILKEDGCITTIYQGKVLETIRQALIELKTIKENNISKAIEYVDYLIKASEEALALGRSVNRNYHNTFTVDKIEKLKYIKLILQNKNKEKLAFDIIKNKPQAELSLIQFGKIKTYDEYLDYTDKWDLEEYGDLVYTEDEFNLLVEVFKQ
jgi:hypothetical protein